MSMRWEWDSEGREVPTEPELTVEDLLDTLDEPDPGELSAEVKLNPQLRGACLSIEALAQVSAGLHAVPDLLESLEEFPEAETVLHFGMLYYLYGETNSGQDMLRLLDITTAWESPGGFVHALGKALGGWMEAHLLPEHIHYIVVLPGIGHLPVRVGYGSEPNLLMALPNEALFDE